MTIMKAALLLFLIALSTAQTFDPNTQSYPNRGNVQPNVVVGDPINAINPAFNIAALNKIQIIIRILKILKDLGFDIPCFIKDLIKKLPLNRLKKLLDWFLKNNVR